MKKLVGVLFGVILAVSGLLLTGCGDPYKDMKLVSETPVVELSVGEEKQVIVSVEGVGDDVSKILDFSPDGEFVTVLEPTEQIGNKTRATIKGLKVGNGTIVVTSSEAQKNLTLQVVVNDNIQSFVRNSKNAFIVREAGQTLNLNPKTHFDFIPTNTLIIITTEILFKALFAKKKTIL